MGEKRERARDRERERERTGPSCYRCIRVKPYSLFLFLFLFLPLVLFHSPFRYRQPPATLLCAEPFRDRIAIGPPAQWCSGNPASAGPFLAVHGDVHIRIHIYYTSTYKRAATGELTFAYQVRKLDNASATFLFSLE